MADQPTEERITAATAAQMLGVQLHTLYRLIEDSELGRTIPYRDRANGQPRRRRTFELTRGDVEEFIRRSRVTPGTLSHLYAPSTGPPPPDVAQIDDFCRDAISLDHVHQVWLEASSRGHSITIWACRPDATTRHGPSVRNRLAQLRFDPTSAAWDLFYPFGWSRWRHAAGAGAGNVDIATALDSLASEAVATLLI